MSNSTLNSLRRRLGNRAAIILAGSIGFAIGLLTNLGYLPRSRVLNTVVPFSSMVMLILCASFSLSRRLGEYARKSRGSSRGSIASSGSSCSRESQREAQASSIRAATLTQA